MWKWLENSKCMQFNASLTLALLTSALLWGMYLTYKEGNVFHLAVGSFPLFSFILFRRKIII